VANETRPTLAEYVGYLPRVQALGLTPDELRAIPVHPEPTSNEEIVSLGELPPGAPPVGPERFPFVGTRPLYAYHSEVPPARWRRLVDGLSPRQPSGTGGTGMFGNEAEKVVDEENPKRSWHSVDAGRGP
jgi:hypothetical protein